MGKNCAIPGCPNEKYNGKYLKGFGFPQDKELRKQWIDIIKMNCPAWVETKFPRFCALHFDKNDIMDGTNFKLQYRAVPVYFNKELKQPAKKQKISSLIRQMNQNQLLYSSDSECEYQVVVRVHKKPRKRNFIEAEGQLRCVYCNMKKNDALSMQEHLDQVHGLVVSLLNPQDVMETKSFEYDENNCNLMCTECGLVFKEAPIDAVNHVQNSHFPATEQSAEQELIYEEIQIDENNAIVEEEIPVEYIYEEVEDVKPVVVKQEYQEVIEEPLIEENVRTTFKCKLCNIDFMSKEEIKYHINEIHNPSTQQQQPKEETNENNNDASEEDPETYEPICYICATVCVNLSKMRKHIRAHHQTEEFYFCSHCTGTFTSLDMYEDHECLEEVLQ